MLSGSPVLFIVLDPTGGRCEWVLGPLFEVNWTGDALCRSNDDLPDKLQLLLSDPFKELPATRDAELRLSFIRLYPIKIEVIYNSLLLPVIISSKFCHAHYDMIFMGQLH